MTTDRNSPKSNYEYYHKIQLNPTICSEVILIIKIWRNVVFRKVLCQYQTQSKSEYKLVKSQISPRIMLRLIHYFTSHVNNSSEMSKVDHVICFFVECIQFKINECCIQVC